MLSIYGINNIDYYTEEDYYQTPDQQTGVWIGRGAMALGIANRVIGTEYASIMHGFAPDGKTPLCTMPGKEHKPGWDLTFSAPKSVSLIWASADEPLRDMISEAQFIAVKRAISFLEKHAAYTRRGHGGQLREPVIGFVVATFEHETSRDLDPQLHTHSLVVNVAPRSDGTWGTIVSHDLFLWQKSAGTIYRAELAHQLNQLGFAVEPDGSEFRLACVSKDVSLYFSKRANAINEFLEKTNTRSSASSIGDRAKLITRQAKRQVDRIALLERWKIELNEFGIDEAFIKTHKGPRLSVKSNFEFSSERILSALTTKTAVFKSQNIYQLVAEQLQCSGLSAIEIQDLALSIIHDQELVSLGNDYKNSQLFTTKNMLRIENEVVELAKNLFESEKYKLSKTSVMMAVSIMEKNIGYLLSQEQRMALINTCCSGDLSILQGSAGAGKSSTMAALKCAYESNGCAVIGAAIAKRAADNLQEETNITSYTIAKIINDYDRGRNHFASADVLVIDEAGQIGTKQLHIILNIATENNVKIVLVGEDKQLDAIEHGGCLKYLSRILDCSRIEIIKRQRDCWAREAVAQLRDGNASTALETFNERGLLNFCSNADEAKRTLVQVWNQYRLCNATKSTLLLAQKWEDVNFLSAEVRKILQEDGTVSIDEVEVDCIVSEHRCSNKFAQGDRIKFCKNDYVMRISNGTFGTIQAIKKYGNYINFSIMKDDGEIITINKNNYHDEGRLPLALGYALTVYASQGTTIDGDVFIYWTSGMDRANSYVAGSRHRDKCHWFFNNQEIDSMDKSDIENEASIADKIKYVASVMSFDYRKTMAIEHLSIVQAGEQKTNLLNKSIDSLIKLP